MTTVLLLAHPDFAASRANRALLAGLNDLPELEVAELYALYPDGKIDAAVERERPLRANVAGCGKRRLPCTTSAISMTRPCLGRPRITNPSCFRHRCWSVEPSRR